jgi:enoyl-CoA hydratase/carnithine racemase
MNKEVVFVTLVEIEERENIAVMKFTNGVTNPINLDFIKELSDSLKTLEEDSSVTGVVLTGSNDKFFSIGFDLPTLYKKGKKEIRTFYVAYNRLSLFLYTYPKPTVAAMNGHAIAGGCILALCCDYRVIASGRKLMGLNEIKLGLPVPYPGDVILKEIIGSRYAQMIMEMGDFYGPDELMQMGMVNQIEKQKGVLEKSIEQARLLGGYPAQAFGMIKRNRVNKVKKHIMEDLDEKENYFLKCWFSDETRKLLKEAKKKF